jgi:hypothetical protein
MAVRMIFIVVLYGANLPGGTGVVLGELILVVDEVEDDVVGTSR